MTSYHKIQRIEICGAISSGKSTLAKLIDGNGVNGKYENFQSNPFFEAFYVDPIDNAFEAEITFLLLHYHMIKNGIKEKSNFVCDFSLILDIAYIDVTLVGSENKVFTKVWDEIINKVGYPEKLVYLKCSEEVLLERIKNRGREAEKTIGKDYLYALNNAIENRINSVSNKTDVIVINSGLEDFYSNEITQKNIVNKILE